MHFTVEAQRIANDYLTPGAIAVDATCGNGFDTLYLCERVGNAGLVYAIDLQAEAVARASHKLVESGYLSRCRLRVGSHADLKSMVAVEHVGKIAAIMFNLGYLPFGDKSIVTEATSTVTALEQALEVVRLGGLISVLAYLGHPGGQAEGTAVEHWIARHASRLEVKKFQDPNNASSPILWSLTRKEP